jgi:gluconolactonase
MQRAFALFPFLCLAQNGIAPVPTIEKIETVSASHKFVEGPVWSAEESILLFSDVAAKRIHRIDSKGLSVFREDSGGATGNTFDGKGRLLTCEAHARRVTRTDKRGKQEVLADQFEGKKLNAPNDVVVSRQDHIYFTDPAFGSAVDVRELPFNGVFHITPRGELSVALRWQTRPNGIAITPDGRTLYVGNVDERNVRAYDIAKDGGLANERILITKTDGVPGGMKVGPNGNLYVAATGIDIYSPSGDLLTKIPLGQKPSNLAFGDSDLRSLYVTARTTLFRVRFEVPGASPD